MAAVKASLHQRSLSFCDLDFSRIISLEKELPSEES